MLQRGLNPSPRTQQTLQICEQSTRLYTRYPIVARAWPSARAKVSCIQSTRLRHDCLNPPQDNMPILLNDTKVACTSI